MKKLSVKSVRILGYIWCYMNTFGALMLLMLCFGNGDYDSVCVGLFMLNFAFSIAISIDLYSHCHNVKVWKDDCIKEINDNE